MKSKDTKIELKFRAILADYIQDFETNVYGIKGRPDIFFRDAKVCIFINGCYWHGHRCSKTLKKGAHIWAKNATETQLRDQHIYDSLLKEGYQSFTVWECSTTAELKKMAAVIRSFVNSRV